MWIVFDREKERISTPMLPRDDGSGVGSSRPPSFVFDCLSNVDADSDYSRYEDSEDYTGPKTVKLSLHSAQSRSVAQDVVRKFYALRLAAHLTCDSDCSTTHGTFYDTIVGIQDLLL